MTGFATSVDRLINQVGHWEQSRWWSRVGLVSDSAPETRDDSQGPDSEDSVAKGSDAKASGADGTDSTDTHSKDAGAPAPTRADVVHALVQRLADRDAEAERRPRRPVPRPTDLVLPDQLRVVADDLIAAAPGDDILKIAADDVEAVRRTIQRA